MPSYGALGDRWRGSYPSVEFDPLPVWDGVVRGREVMVSQIRDAISDGLLSDSNNSVVTDVLDRLRGAEMDMYERAADSCRRQHAFHSAMRYLRDVTAVIKVTPATAKSAACTTVTHFSGMRCAGP